MSRPVRTTRWAGASTHPQTFKQSDWNAIVGNGGEARACRWCSDQWRLSWQISPPILSEGIARPDPVVAARVLEAKTGMRKSDVATIEAALRG